MSAVTAHQQSVYLSPYLIIARTTEPDVWTIAHWFDIVGRPDPKYVISCILATSAHIAVVLVLCEGYSK
jgi:hypothetical protein